jgi:hypothetical protein
MVSIIICSNNAAKYRACEAMYQRLFPPGTMEMVRIADAKSLAEGYNRGIAQAAGEHLLLVHDDVEILSPDLAERLDAHLARFDIVGLAGTSLLMHSMWVTAGPPFIHGQIAHPSPKGGFVVDLYSASCRFYEKMQALDGLFLAMRKEVALKIGFDEATFDGFHLYDLDFTFRAYLAGLSLAVVCDVHALHHSVGQYDQVWSMYGSRFYEKHVARLSPISRMEGSWGWIRAVNRDEIRAAMTPRVWGQS